jgi:hypothetical protein
VTVSKQSRNIHNAGWLSGSTMLHKMPKIIEKKVGKINGENKEIQTLS